MAPAMAQAPGSDVNEERPYQLSDAYVIAQYVPTPLKTPPPWTYCSCINFAKAYLGVTNQVWGYAGAIAPDSTEPAIGAVVLTTEGGGHAAVVTNIENGMLDIIEANYKHCEVSMRKIPIDSPKIRGYKHALPLVQSPPGSEFLDRSR